jgi:TPP-dependent pyruvate/acetoin dehydrogenase alpha subunit
MATWVMKNILATGWFLKEVWEKRFSDSMIRTRSNEKSLSFLVPPHVGREGCAVIVGLKMIQWWVVGRMD